MQGTQGFGVSPFVVTHQQQNNILTSNNIKKPESNDGSVQSWKSEYAVLIQNLNKSYSKNGPAVIQNLCVNVRKGIIYGLLGSSGCGKTTVLSCIVGLKKWDSGDVLVFGERPGTKKSGIPGKTIGYMPQDLALYSQLSFREIIQFYARIYNLTHTVIRERWTFLCQLLELSSDFKRICDLSGGQKRRASLALALLHSPKLLVLDEPTVGLDPLLRESIWKHLRKIVDTLGATIIITTHYIEEARLSDTIGVMRNGRLLVEASPLSLLTSFKCERLEQVVLQLCRQNELKLTNICKNNDLSYQEVPIEVKSICEDNVNNSVSAEVDDKVESGSRIKNSRLYQALRRIYGMTTVLLLTFTRYPTFLGFLLVMPFFYGAITLWGVGGKPKELGFGIVNHELLDWSAECNLPRHSRSTCDLTVLSCKFINLLKMDNLFALKSLSSEENALEQAHQGQLWGYLSFPSNFTQHTLDRVVATKFAFNETIDGSEIHVRLDLSQNVASFFMIKKLVFSYLAYIKQLVESCDLGGQQAEIPLSYKKPIYGDADGDDFTTFVMPGVILIFLYGAPGLLTAMQCIGDRKEGTLSRAVVAGLTTFDVIASHLITQAIFSTCIFFIWNAVIHYIFGIINNGSMWLCLVFYVFTALAGTGLGLFLETFCNNEVEAMVIGMFLVPIYIFFGGTYFPRSWMSKCWQLFGSIIPTTLSTVSLRSVMVRGAGMMHPTVWPGLAVLTAWVITMPLFSGMRFRKSCE